MSSDDMTITLRDVLYAHKLNKENFWSLKYNTMTNYGNFTEEEFNKYKDRYKAFVKGLIWYYEKETRLLVSLKEHIVRKLFDDKTYLIKMNFGEKFKKNFQIQLAPEVTSIADEIINNQYKCIEQFYYESSSISLSGYSGDIKMGLVNEKRIKEEMCCKCTRNNQVVN